MAARKCKMCKSTFVGRSDKIFCSANCKAIYHVKLKKVTHEATELIDTILHRNRSTLLEIMGKKLLDAKKFNWTYITHYHINKQGKTVHYVFDFSYIVFSDQEVLIKRIL